MAAASDSLARTRRGASLWRFVMKERFEALKLGGIFGG
jgi:hypothetical protein